MRYLARWLGGTAGILTLAVGGMTGSAAASQVGTGPAAKVLSPFRVDVSRHPQIGVVVTVTGSAKTLTSRDFTVDFGRTSEHPSVRRLSGDDVQLVFSPDLNAPPTEFNLERAAAASLPVGLPAGAWTAVAPSDGFTSDPSATVTDVKALHRGPRRSAAARLTAALSAFSSGARVRRTVVLVVAADQPLGAAAASRFRQQLAASGTALYVLDASRNGAPAYDALAAGSGGIAARIRTAGDWLTAFSRVSTDLNGQYYLRFTDSLPLPGEAGLVVHTAAGPVRGVVRLPTANPVALAPLASPSEPSRPFEDWPLTLMGLVLVGLVIAYGFGMLAASRREPRWQTTAGRKPSLTGSADSPDAGDLFFVFLMPCLNEETVIVNSLQRLLSVPGDNFAVMVIDDGSDDDTGGVVSSIADDRVWLLQRTMPNARQGKGEALNAAVDHLTDVEWLEKRDPGKVIVVVVDADGRLDPHSLTAVTPYFGDPAVGAVQIGVRINNRGMSRLARMQDMEFVIYTEVFQRGRRHLGSVGLGGNGQFMRLSALRSLGETPWTRSLTEDLDLGIRLLTAGWRNDYCSTAAVHQQGVVELRRLIRQRSRWFQGHLQSWKLIPTVLRRAPGSARADLLYHLSSPAILLIASVLTASFVCSLLGSGFIAAQGGDPLGWWMGSTYALAFGPALIYSYTYWLRERENGVSLIRTAGLAHLYVCYGLMWYAAGWWAVGRTLRGRTGWAKTDRVAEAPLPASGPLAIGPWCPPDTAGVLPHPMVTASHQALREAGSRQEARRDPRSVGRCRVATAAVCAENGTFPSDPAEPAPRPRSAPPAPEPRPRHRGWRNRMRAIAVAGVAALAVFAVAVLSSGGGSRPGHSQWYQVFSGYGHTRVTGSGAHQAITLSVAPARSKRVTHAALVLSKARYQDFVASTKVRTVRQLRSGSAGNPNPWEVGWVVWHYSSAQHFYALTLEPTGWLLSKQDPAYRGDERFLASGKLPRFPVGSTHSVGIVQIGNHITVSADGRLLAKFTDTQRPYLTGGFGTYAEDSVASFRDIRLQSLPSAASYTPKTQPASVNR